MSGYIICTSPRSGSTMLCTMLAATGQAGQPWSFFHRSAFKAEWASAWGLPARDDTDPAAWDEAYVRAAARAGRGEGGVFGMRLQQPYLRPLCVLLARLYPAEVGDAARLVRAFGSLRFVHLHRADKVAQAVSLVRAEQTGLWHRHADGRERERLAPPAPPSFDPAAIGAAVATLTAADQAWDAWFTRERIQPLRIGYEALAAAPGETLAALCAALHLPAPVGPALDPPTARLADTLNQEWAARFRVGDS